jgi:hypothetical protein
MAKRINGENDDRHQGQQRQTDWLHRNAASNDRVVTVNQLDQVATVTTRDRTSGQVKTETFFGALPLVILRLMRRFWRGGLFGGGFGAGEAGLEEFDLAVVVGFVFGNVEPFAVIIGAEFGVDGGEPLVIAFAECGEIFFAGLAENIQVVVETVALDGFAGGLVKIHGNVPFLFDVGRPAVPLHAVESVHAVVGFGGGEMEKKRADSVGFGVEKKIEVGLRHAFDVVQNLHAGEGQHGNQSSNFGGESGARADDPGIVALRCCGAGKMATAEMPEARARLPLRKLRRLGRHSDGSMAFSIRD